MIELSGDTGGSTARTGFAGDTLNTAVYLRRNAADVTEVTFLSVIGNDAYSDQMARFIGDEGLDTRFLSRHPDRIPGLYAITTDEKGERSFLYWRDQSAARTMFEPESPLPLSSLDHFDLVYYSAISLAILSEETRTALSGKLAAFRKKGGLVAFDSNYRPRLWPDRETARTAVTNAWLECDIALPSVDDEMNLFGDPDEAAVLRRFEGYGVKTGALKRGASGPLPLGDDKPAELPLFEPAREIVDTTAAGDSFNGAYLAAYTRGEDQAARMLAGHNCARTVIGHRGAIIPQEAMKSAATK